MYVYYTANWLKWASKECIIQLFGFESTNIIDQKQHWVMQ